MKIEIQQSVLGGIIGTAVMTLTMLPAAHDRFAFNHI